MKIATFLEVVCQGLFVQTSEGFLGVRFTSRVYSDMHLWLVEFMYLYGTGLHCSDAPFSEWAFKLCPQISWQIWIMHCQESAFCSFCRCPGSFICQNCLLMHWKAWGINSNIWILISMFCFEMETVHDIFSNSVWS